MSTAELKQLLDQVADTREIVLRHPRTWSASFDAWAEAHEETAAAYAGWLGGPTADAYVVYRAAQDREDAAQDVLALTAPAPVA